MNFAQAKKAIAAAFGPYGVVEHAPRVEKKFAYRVFIVVPPPTGIVVNAPGPKYVCIGAGSSWKKAVAMALKSERPTPVIPGLVLPTENASTPLPEVTSPGGGNPG